MGVKKFAVVEGSEVVNLILLDEGNDFEPPAGCVLIAAPEHISIGWQRGLDKWDAPEEPEAPEIPLEDPVVTEAKYEGLTELLSIGISEPTARRILGLPQEEA